MVAVVLACFESYDGCVGEGADGGVAWSDGGAVEGYGV